jgi:glycosyltransferase involved in cell wall biosynthesis
MSQRKGLGDLFAAFRLLKSKHVELVVMGSAMTTMDFYKKEMSNFIYEPGRPHQEVLKLMQSCDVFCLPSIVEGRALVMQEAMSQGLPLIITPNTGGADLIKEGMTGFLIPIRSPELIAEKINWFLDNRDKVQAMGKMAQEHAALYSWKDYGNNIVKYLKNVKLT